MKSMTKIRLWATSKANGRKTMNRWSRSQFRGIRMVNKSKRNSSSGMRTSQISTKSMIRGSSISWPKPRLSCWMFWYQRTMKTLKSKVSSSRSMTRTDSLSLRKASTQSSWPLGSKVSSIASILSLTSRPTYLTLTWSRAKSQGISDKSRKLSISKDNRKSMKS